MIGTKLFKIFALFGAICLTFGCQKTKHSVIPVVDPYVNQGIPAVKEGNLQLIVSSIDKQYPKARVLIEIQKKKPGEVMTTEPKRLFYNTLPEADANILVLSHYVLESGEYKVKFWEENTGTAAETSIHVSKEKNYLVAFYSYEENKDGEMAPKFKIRHSNTPIVTDLTPRQIGKVD